MSKYVIGSSTLVSIGDAVREKDGTSAPIVVSDLATRIKAIETGGGGGGAELPAEAFKITGNCSYRFANNGWNWFINLFGDKVTTENISECGNMFTYGNFTTIPFNLNVTSSCIKYNSMFNECRYLTNAPLIIPAGTIPPPTGAYSGMIDISNMFSYCQRLREVPYDYFNNFITQEQFNSLTSLGKEDASDSPFLNVFPWKDNTGRPSSISKNESCFSAVTPVRGWNQ